MSRAIVNPLFSADYVARLPSRTAVAFHHRLPGYEATPLHALPETAKALGVGEVWVKTESLRMGLPSFKILGASFAAYRALAERLGKDPEPWADLDALRATFSPLSSVALVAASTGNHGRAVARVAKLFGVKARIYLPADTAPVRIQPIATEGAEIVHFQGTYADAVRAASQAIGSDDILIQDSAKSLAEVVPSRIVDGYATMFFEIDEELKENATKPPEVIFLQVGVGSMAAAAIRHWRRPGLSPVPMLVGVEALTFAPLLESVAMKKLVPATSTGKTIMSGLECTELSVAAWPALSSALEAIVGLDDERCMSAMNLLAEEDIVAGASGAAGLGALAALMKEGGLGSVRDRLKLGPTTRVLIITTEGATDPEIWRAATGRAPKK